MVRLRFVSVILSLLLIISLVICSCTKSRFSMSYELSVDENCLTVALTATNQGRTFAYVGDKYMCFSPANITSVENNIVIYSVNVPVSTDATRRTWKKGESYCQVWSFIYNEPIPEGSYDLNFLFTNKPYHIPLDVKYPN